MLRDYLESLFKRRIWGGQPGWGPTVCISNELPGDAAGPYPAPALPLPVLIHEPNIPGSCVILFFTTLALTFTIRHTSTTSLLALSLPLPSLWSYEELPSALPKQHTGHLPTLGAPFPVSCLFAFSHCSWGSRSKNTRVVGIPSSSRPRSVRTPHCDPSVLAGPTRYGS